MKKLIIPKRFENVNFEKDVPQTLKDDLLKFKTEGKGLFLYGDSGTGKTHTAYAYLKKLSELGFGVAAFPAIDILRYIKEDIATEGRDNAEWFNGNKFFDGQSINDNLSFIEGLRDFKGVLFIDDFGTEKGTEWMLEIFYSILNQRYADMLPTIITSNCDLDVIGQRMGDRISSRIIEMCRAYKMGGEDKRLKDSLNENN